MKKIICIIIILSYSRQIHGQTNLVFNPSFETFTTCPSSGGDVNKVVGWDTCRGSADFFNICASSTAFQAPKNLFGFQKPANGNTYCGFYTYSPGGFYREILIGQLTTSLTVSQKYFVSFKISRADSNYMIGWSTNKVGIKLSKVKINNVSINNSANYFNNTVITDTINWTLVSGSFYADSAYRYVMVGNFFDDLNTTKINDGNGADAYYFIDDLCISTDSIFTKNYSTGLNELWQTEKLKVYPNPASTFININYNKSINEFSLLNLQGQAVLCKKNLINKSIEISEIPDGIYFYRILADNATHYDKIIVRH